MSCVGAVQYVWSHLYWRFRATGGLFRQSVYLNRKELLFGTIADHI